MRVLVTGAAGSIGSVLCSGLVDRGHDVLGLDLMVEPEGFTGGWFTADCADPDAVAAVFDAAVGSGGLDAVVHLAGIPHESSLPDALTSHVVTTGVLLDAMLEHGVSRIAYASSNHAVGFTERAALVGDDIAPRPDTFYGVGKVGAEALLRLYVDRHGIDAVATRIGSFLPQPETRRHLSTWLSHDDAVRMFDACLNAADPGFSVIYGISANTRAWWDLRPGRELGYLPQDDAEHFAGAIEATPEADSDRVDADHVGGHFTTDRFHRRAVDRA
ncbi:MAG: UDP-glucose 4-epimerase [uncultured Nocardioidaceae bacterium]|uniref:UDP-glucose 4-epimerase n=1 Tax=uncultured Nocardioidaceae bacterium TaxID=253824 RepID=A0A6J4M6Y1_9ACTN|nr:MAG: UDP-glucose 4-epimerase [uncultured Nocardioidaceae bacterium]